MKRTALQIFGILALLASWSFASHMPASRLVQLVNYPNPFHSSRTSTTIAYSLTADAGVAVRIYDALGALVREWNFPAGDYGARAGFNTLIWDGSSEDGKKLATGTYICQVLVDENSGKSESIRKIGLIR